MSLWKRIRVYHHRGWKGCALHTIIFIFNIAHTHKQREKKNMLDETRLFNMLPVHLLTYQTMQIPIQEWGVRATRKKTPKQQKEFSEGLKSLITREICALRIKSVCRAIAEHFFSQFCVHWLFFRPLWFQLENLSRVVGAKTSKAIFKPHSKNSMLFMNRFFFRWHLISCRLNDWNYLWFTKKKSCWFLVLFFLVLLLLIFRSVEF